MKRTIRLFPLLLLVFAIQSGARSAGEEDVLAGIIGRFAHEDTAVQYEARRELASYVADGTAPDKPGGAEKITRELLGFLNSRTVNYEARKYIVRDLARVGTETAVEPLGKIMLGKDLDLAEDARRALEQIKGDDATAVFRKAIAGAKDDSVRQTYIRSLANRRDPSVVDYFIKGLSSKDKILAHESVYALTKMGDSASAKALEKAYNDRPAAALKPDLERSLVALPEVGDSTHLMIAESSADSANRQAALVRLVESAHAQTNELLSSALAGADARLRATAIRLALENGKASLVQTQVKNFSTDDWRIVLGELKVFEAGVAENLALQALQHSDTGIKGEAIRALGTYGSGKSVDLILEHFSSRDKELQLAATYAIERVPGNPMNFRINRLLQSQSESEITLGIQLLAHRHLPNAKTRLFKFINGENITLIREALKTLSTTADEEDLYKLLFLARRSDEPIKNLISAMLKKVASEIGSLELQAKVAAL